jgi:Arc/MetJ family transcription regulator
MRTTMDIPESLLEEAKTAAGVKTKTQAVLIALTELIQRRKSRKIVELRGSMDSRYDHKAGRRK